MESMELPKDLRNDIEHVQNELKNGIRNHQVLVLKLKENPESVELQKLIQACQHKIISIGLEQKKLVERLRKEFRNHQKNVKKNAIKNGIEDRRITLNNSLNRARKQNITTFSNNATRPTSVASSASEESENVSEISSSEPMGNPINAHDLTQEQFLAYFRLATHDVYKEMQNRRVERKRRSTTNPLFVYTREWNASTQKRKRASPPTTRTSTRSKRGYSPPKRIKSRSVSPIDLKKNLSGFPTIPNLPTGLTIERVPAKTGDMTKCIECNLTGTLRECEYCKNGFHVSCHNKPFNQTPKHCPRCLNLEEKGFNFIDLTEKIKEKKELQEKNKSLCAELTQLQDKHSQLTISLRNQKTQREELLMSQQSTEEKIKQILTFIEAVKNPKVNAQP